MTAKQATYLAFLDITKAFTNSSQPMLWAKLLKLGLSVKDVGLLRLLATDCTSSIQFQPVTVKEPIHIKEGVKEGARLSALEFTLFINDLPTRHKNKGFGPTHKGIWNGVLIHADDIILIASSMHELK